MNIHNNCERNTVGEVLEILCGVTLKVTHEI